MARRVIPKGVKQVRKRLATGRLKTYWYHRLSGRQIRAEPGSVEALLEVQALDGKSAKLAEVARHASAMNLSGLWRAYRASPEFQQLKPRTKADYDRVREWIGAGADLACPQQMKSAEILKLRDKAFEAKGRRFANYVVQVLRLVLEWGGPGAGWTAIRRETRRGV